MPEKTQTKSYRQRMESLFDEMLVNAATKDEVKEVADTFIDQFKKMTALVSEKMVENKTEMSTETARLGSQVADFEKRIRDIIDTKESGLKSELDALRNEMSADVGYLESLIEYYDDTELREKLEEVKNMIPEMPEMPEKFDPSDILKKLDDHKTEIDALRKRPTGGGTRRVFQPYLDRFQGDGSTKTFYLKREPLRTDNIEVWGTDFPIVLDPDNDFTVTGKNLTLTSEVDAPTNGAILVIKYYA